MTPATVDETRELRLENAHLEREIELLRAENERLCRENRDLQATLDAHVYRARSTAMFGPVELTAGTSVGPRRSGH